MNIENIPYSEGTPTDLMAGPFRMNRCYYIDNREILSLLPANYFTACITDPPYNIKCHLSGVERDGSKKIVYSDKKSDSEYWEQLFMVFDYLKERCEIIAFTPGYTNARRWLREYNLWYVCWVDTSKQGACKIAWFSKFELILVHGIDNRPQKERLLMALFKFNNTDMSIPFIHPCPKPVEYYDFFIDGLNIFGPVLDPYFGSGGLAHSAEKHSIPWLGFEIMEEYRPDIEKRIKLGIKERQKPKQETLF